MPVPIAVFGYSRPPELERTLRSLAACRGFAGRPVHLFLDGAKGRHDAQAVAQVGALVDRLDLPELIVQLSLVAGLTRAELDAVLQRLAARWAADDAIATLVDSLTVRLVST